LHFFFELAQGITYSLNLRARDRSTTQPDSTRPSTDRRHLAATAAAATAAVMSNASRFGTTCTAATAVSQHFSFVLSFLANVQLVT